MKTKLLLLIVTSIFLVSNAASQSATINLDNYHSGLDLHYSIGSIPGGADQGVSVDRMRQKCGQSFEAYTWRNGEKPVDALRPMKGYAFVSTEPCDVDLSSDDYSSIDRQSLVEGWNIISVTDQQTFRQVAGNCELGQDIEAGSVAEIFRLTSSGSERIDPGWGMDASSAYWVEVESECTMSYDPEGVISGPPEDDEQSPQDLEEMADDVEQQEEDSDSSDQYNYDGIQEQDSYSDGSENSSTDYRDYEDSETDDQQTVPFPNGRDALQGSFTLSTPDGEKDYQWELTEYPESRPSPGDDIEFQVEITSEEADLGDGTHNVDLGRNRDSSGALSGDATFSQISFNECTGRSGRCWIPLDPATISTQDKTSAVRMKMRFEHSEVIDSRVESDEYRKTWYIAMEDE